MKGKISNQRTPIIFAGVTGKVYKNGSMQKLAKVDPTVIVRKNVESETVENPIKLTALQVLMNEKFPNLHHDTRDGAINTFPNFPTEIKDQIIMQGYAVENVFTVLENYNNIDKKPTIELQIDEGAFPDIPATLIVEPYPNQDNTNKNTKSSDKKLLFLGVGLGLGILLLTLNN